MATPLVSYDIATDREDLSDVLSTLEQYDTPLLDRVMGNGLACTNTTHDWVNKKLQGVKGVVVTTCNSSTTSLTLSGESALGIPVKYLKYTVIEIGDEQIQITADPVANSTNWDVTVTRGYAGTTAAAHTADDEVDVIGRPLPENFEPSDSEHQFGSKDSNITEIFGGYVEMTRTSRSINVAGSDNNVSTQINDVLRRKKKELEVAAIRGKQRVDGSGDNRKMDGLAGFLSATAETIDASSNALSVDLIDDAIDELLEVGAKPTMILTSLRQKKRFRDLKIARVENAQPQSDKKISNLVDVYESEAGELPIITSHDVKKNELFILQDNLIKVVPLNRSNFGMFPQGKKGSKENMYIEGEFTMELRNPEAHRRITNLSV
jgi:hypothetical protein